MNQALYAHMNNKRKMKKKIEALNLPLFWYLLYKAHNPDLPKSSVSQALLCRTLRLYQEFLYSHPGTSSQDSTWEQQFGLHFSSIQC
jgi:hypothetical protein